MSSIFKYSLIFLVLLFGFFMFIAGMLLPQDFYARLEPTIQKLGVLKQELETTVTSEIAVPSQPDDTAAKPETENIPNASGDEAITHYAELMLPAYEVEDSLFSVQAGLYSDEGMAKQMQTRLLRYEILSFYIRVADDQKRHWYLLYFGKYSNIDAAQTASYELLAKSGYKSQIIRHPPEKNNIINSLTSDVVAANRLRPSYQQRK